MWDYRARVDRVIDGDTVVATLDLGFDLTITIHVRMLDTYAPERGQPGYTECANYVRSWLADRPGEWPVVVTTQRIANGEHEDMSFARYVAGITAGFDSLNADVEHFITANGYGPGDETPNLTLNIPRGTP